jgi:hypothetical protein
VTTIRRFAAQAHQPVGLLKRVDDPIEELLVAALLAERPLSR